MDQGKVIQVASYIFVLIGAFLAINFSQTLGLIYALFIVGIVITTLFDKNIEFPLFRKEGWISSILWGIGGYVILTIITSLILQGIFVAQGLGFIKVISATLPAFSNLPIFTWIAYALFVGSIETIAFIRIWELLGNVTKSNFKLSSGGMWISLFVSSGLFAIFHSTSKGLSFLPLLIVGIMMFVSLLITLITGDMRGAILLHIFANSLAVLSRFDALPNFLIMSFMFIFILKEKSLIKIIK